MTNLLTALVLVFTMGFNPSSDKPNKIKLDSKYKVETTFSGNRENDDTFHLIIAKNKDSKDYEIIPFIYELDNLKQLEPIVFSSEPSILSFHNNGSVISLITSHKSGKDELFTVYDVNTDTGGTEKSNPIKSDDFKAVSRNKNTSLLVFLDKKNIKIINAKSSQSIDVYNSKSTKENSDLLKEFAKNTLESVNTNEFVANGSIGDYQLFSDDTQVYFMAEDRKQNTTTISSIALDGQKGVDLVTKVFKTDVQDVKSSSSYIDDSNLYKFEIGKDSGTVSSFNIHGDSSPEKIDISEATISKKAKGFENLEDFYKHSKRAANQPTMTVNHRKDGNLVMRFDYVKKSDYSYRYNWWWHHQMFMMHQMMWQQQQQQMMNNVPRFGPAVDDYYNLAKDEAHYFEIVLNEANEIIDSDTAETVYKDIDRKEYVKELDKDKSIKLAASVFTNTHFRYFGYDKESDSYMVFEKKLDDKF